MRTAPAVDRGPTVIATAFGVFWRLSALAICWAVFLMVCAMIYMYWWVVLTVVVLGMLAYLVMAVREDLRQHPPSRG